ncbi:hypothetical protein ACFL5Q_07365, partial [Planctomycetota bacterium]
ESTAECDRAVSRATAMVTRAEEEAAAEAASPDAAAEELPVMHGSPASCESGGYSALVPMTSCLTGELTFEPCYFPNEAEKEARRLEEEWRAKVYAAAKAAVGGDLGHVPQDVAETLPGATCGNDLSCRHAAAGVVTEITVEGEKYWVVLEFVPRTLWAGGWYYKKTAIIPASMDPNQAMEDLIFAPKTAACVAGAKMATEIGASCYPYVGEAMDVAVIGSPSSSWWQRVLCAGSLGLNACVVGVIPNAGGVIRAAKEAPSLARGADDIIEAPSGIAVSVYRSVGADGSVQYVGITNNMARRSAEHLRTNGFQIEKVMGNLSRSDALAVEQVLIETHQLGKNGGTLLNRINSISRTNPAYADQLRRGRELLKWIGY